MKWQNAVLVIVVLVLLLTSLVYFKDIIFPDKRELSESEQRGMVLLKIAKDACLSGSNREARLGVNFEGDLTKKLGANAGIEESTSQGAVNYLDEQVRAVADDTIRTCLEKHMPEIRACMLGDCDQASLPKVIDFKFSTEPEDSAGNALSLSTARFAVQYREGNRVLAPQDDGYFLDSIELFKKDEKRIAQIAFQVREAHQQRSRPAEICLQRAAQVDPKWKNYTIYDCHTDGKCSHNKISPQWFDQCAASSTASAGLSPVPTDYLPHLFARAYAQPTASSWAVPTLDTLRSRIADEDLTGIGYTHFSIRSDAPVGVDADAFYYDLSVNGQAIHVDGLAGEFNVSAYSPTEPLAIDFGLQNLNFTGIKNGCDELSLTLYFLKDARSVGEPITWHRSYVSLRNAGERSLAVADTRLKWDGKYQRAPREFDTEVFVNSILVSRSLDFAANSEGITRARQDISKMKTGFDEARLSFEGRPLVAVIRPPLTQISYGLAVGVVEPTGQIRYTFSSAVAQRLLSFLLDKRAATTRYDGIIRQDSFLYSLRSDDSYSVSPPVCWDETHVTG